jgi:predicted aldo/keto reductase-like oxidoreductase
MRMNRRIFLRSTAAGMSGWALGTVGVSTTRADEAAPVIQRTLGRTGLKLPVVSMGVMRADSPALVTGALQKGITFFDTAHGYQQGKNEEMLGEVFAGVKRDSFVLATKVAAEDRDRKTGAIGPNTTAKAFLGRLDISLQRLKMDHVDILYVHAVGSRADTLHPAMLEAVTEARRSGKARWVGVSTHRSEPEVIRAAAESGVYDVVLTSINFTQQHLRDVRAAMAEAAEKGVGIVGMKTMAGGFLDKEKTRPVNCVAALKFVLQDPNLCTTIPGITTFDQLEQNAGVNHDITLTEEERKEIEKASLQGGLYCQGCEQCLPGCPQELPIPDLMRAYMYTYAYQDAGLGREVVAAAGLSNDPCDGCEVCGVRCAKGFPVRDRLRDVARLMNVPPEFLHA